MSTDIVPTATTLSEIYTPDAISSQTKRWQKLLLNFTETYSQRADLVVRSPGRVNIIGEHIDYSLYSVLPMAITADVLIAVSFTPFAKTKGSLENCKVRIANVHSEKFPPRELNVPIDGSVEIDAKTHEWTNYFKCGLKGALQYLRRKHGSTFSPSSMDVLVDGSVPAGGGLSSSAAFVTASALAVLTAFGERDLDKTMLTELAIVSERAVGVNSGGMDQSASVFSQRGSALYVSFLPTLTAMPITFPKLEPELSFLIAQSFVAADKHVTGPVCYNLRVVECTLAAAYLHASLNGSDTSFPSDSSPLKQSLRTFQEIYFTRTRRERLTPREELSEMINKTRAILSKEEGYTREEIATKLGITTIEKLAEKYESVFPVRTEKFMLRQRALHVFEEAKRVLEFMELLSNPPQGDIGKSLGALMNATQLSCRDLYDCSCPELDEICAIAREAGALGSRLTGAGWGGCSVHLVPVDKVQAVMDALESRYYSNLNGGMRDGAMVVSQPGGGSAIFWVGDGGVVR